MADEPEHPALMMLLQLEARLNGLAEELQAVYGRLAYVESRLARLEAERTALLASGSRGPYAIERILLDLADIAPSLSPEEDHEALAEAARIIKARRSCVHVLSDDEKAALDAALRSGVASHEEVAAFRKRRLG
jgi:hypothetical protein